MKKNNFGILSPLVCLIMLISIPGYSATIVTGGIFSSTTWTLANSPYIIKDTVVILPGATVTIQPGVVVEFDSLAEIEQKGGLIANGAINDSIVFTSTSLTPHLGVYVGIYVYSLSDTNSFRYCRFTYAYNAININAQAHGYPIEHCLFNMDYSGIDNGTVPVKNCTFKYDTIGLIFPGTDSVTGCSFLYNGRAIIAPNWVIYNCIFKYNGQGINFQGPAAIVNCVFDSNKAYGINTTGCTIKNCSIKYNGIGISSSSGFITQNDISANYIGIDENGYDQISCNSICNNTHYNIVYEIGTNLSVKNNYWCLPDSAAIQATIYDVYQNLNRGFLYFTPFDTSACVIPNQVQKLPLSSNIINLYPNPSNGRFTIESSLTNSKSFVEIYNVLGEQIYSSQLNVANTEINLNGKSTGVYFYRIIKETGEIIGYGKLIIE